MKISRSDLNELLQLSADLALCLQRDFGVDVVETEAYLQMAGKESPYTLGINSGEDLKLSHPGSDWQDAMDMIANTVANYRIPAVRAREERAAALADAAVPINDLLALQAKCGLLLSVEENPDTLQFTIVARRPAYGDIIARSWGDTPKKAYDDFVAGLGIDGRMLEPVVELEEEDSGRCTNSVDCGCKEEWGDDVADEETQGVVQTPIDFLTCIGRMMGQVDAPNTLFQKIIEDSFSMAGMANGLVFEVSFTSDFRLAS